MTQSRVTMRFDYFRIGDGGMEEMVAHGEQQIACMRKFGAQLVAAPVPESLGKALMDFGND